MTTVEVPASIGQRLLWFMDHYRGAGGVLNCPIVLRLRGPLDRNALALALNRIASRHESLRTTFRGKGRALIQVIHAPRPIFLDDVDLQSEADPESALYQALNGELRTRIDPEQWPVRATLWRLTEADHVLCFNMHHLVTDGHSCGIFVRELHLLYDQAVGGSHCDLPEVGWQYADFVRWETGLLKGPAFRKHLEYWQHQLEGARVPPLPIAVKAPGATTRQTTTYSLDFDNSDIALLRQVGRSHRTTIFNIMLSIYYTLLQRSTLANDLSVGSVFLNRPMAEVQQTMGFFANLLALRTRVPPEAHFADVMRSSHNTVMDAFIHQSLSYYMLPADIMRASTLRVDDVIFQMMTQPLYNSRMGGLTVDALLVEGMGNRFEFELAIINTEDRLGAAISYNQARVARAWAESFLLTYTKLAGLVSRNIAVRLADLPRLEAPQ